MDNVSNLYISDVAKQVIKRYVGKKDYVVRIRVNKKELKHKVEIIVYYEGRKSFEVKNDKLVLDGAYFFTKGNKEFSLPVENAISCLKILGFSFKIGSEINSSNSYHNDGYKYRIFVEPSSAEKGSTGYYDNYKEEINEKMQIILNHLREYDDSFIHVFDSVTNINSFYTKTNDNTIDYFKLNELLQIGIESTVKQKGIKKIKFNEKLVNEKRGYTEVEYRIIDAIMEDRIKSYNFGAVLDDDGEEFVDKREKTYQQLLMNKMFYKEDREKLLSIDNCPFKDSFAYEMEYNLYAANRKERKQGTKKGRVDNIFIKGNKILFTELKYDEEVIGGSNGIHKHLIDLINGFENNNEALSEIYDYVCDYNEVLSCIGGKDEYLIKDVKRFNTDEIEKEFVIICGYSNEDKRVIVRDRVQSMYDLTAVDAGVKKEYSVVLDGEMVHLHKLTIRELILILHERYGCKVKIFIVDDNYSKFELV